MFQKWTESIDLFTAKCIDKVSKINAYHLFSFLGLFTLLPLLFLSFFNHPSCDDFGYSYESLIDTFMNVQVDRYFDWSGRYFSNGILSVDPLVYGNFEIYKFIPIFLFFGFVYSLYYFFGTLFEGVSAKIKWSFTGLIFFLFIFQMPDVCQGFFWLPGSATYQLANVLFLFLGGFILKYYQTKKAFYLIACSFLIFAIIGCNEVITLVMLLLFSSLLIGQYYLNKNADRPLVILFIVTLIFTGFSFLAPGNAVRGTFFETKHQFFHSVAATLVYSTYYMIQWLPIILLCGLFLMDYFDRIINKLKFKKVFVHPLLAFVILFLIICSGIFGGYWSMNMQPPKRAINTIYFFFIFGAFYFLLSLFDYLKRNKNYSFVMPNYIKTVLMFIILMIAVSSQNILNSYLDLLSGNAYKFDKEMKDRYDIINNSKEKNCELPSLENIPLSLYNLDMEITSDKNNWKNQSMSKYYNKESIIITPNVSTQKAE